MHMLVETGSGFISKEWERIQRVKSTLWDTKYLNFQNPGKKYVLLWKMCSRLSQLHHTTVLVKKYEYEWNCQEKRKFLNSSQNKRLSPSCIALSFHGFGSISWHSIWFFRLFYSFHNFFSGFPTSLACFPLKRLE
jgi:hypothetical protein